MRELEARPHDSRTAVRWNAATTLVVTGCQVLQLVVVARWLSPAQFGLAAVAISIVVSLQAFCDLGLTNALVQKQETPKEGWSSAWWATLIMSVFLAVLLFLSAALLERSLQLPGLAGLLTVAAFSLPAFGPAAVCQARLQSRLRFRRLGVADMASSVCALAAAVFWAVRYRHPGALIAGQIAFTSVRLALTWGLSRFHFSWRLRWSDIVPLSAFGGYQMGDRALQFAVTNLDRVLVARLLGPTATGYYTMASQIALRPATLIAPFINRTLLPLLARLQGDKAKMVSSYLRSLSTLGFLSAFIYSLVFGLADPLVHLLVGAKWEPIILTLRILALVGFFTVLGATLESLILALGHARITFWLNAAMLVTRLAGILLGAQYGLTGMAVAMAVLMVLWLPFDLLLPKRWLDVPQATTALAGGWALGPALLTALGLMFVSSRLSWPPLREVALLGVSGTLFFAASAWVLHRRRLREALREITSKLT
jgi:O-antigen/teichoic acid export membrane protein